MLAKISKGYHVKETDWGKPADNDAKHYQIKAIKVAIEELKK